MLMDEIIFCHRIHLRFTGLIKRIGFLSKTRRDRLKRQSPYLAPVFVDRVRPALVLYKRHSPESEIGNIVRNRVDINPDSGYTR